MILYGAYVLSSDRPVFGVCETFLPELYESLSPKLRANAIFLVFPTWTKEPLYQVLSAWKRLRNIPKSQVIWMCSTAKEMARLRLLNYKVELCHQNLFCNENDFSINSAIEKKYTAIYNAVPFPYKRHNLLVGLNDLFLIVGRLDRVDYLNSIGLGEVPRNDKFLTKKEVSDRLNQGRVGLALSAVEGGMLASTEYLLAGLPIISTKSIGGRSEYYTQFNHIICEPTRMGVRRAISDALRISWDPQVIRGDALMKTKGFRCALMEIVCSVGGRPIVDIGAVSGSWFVENFITNANLKEFLGSYSSGVFRRADLLGQF